MQARNARSWGALLGVLHGLEANGGRQWPRTPLKARLPGAPGGAEKGQKQWWLPSSICGSLIR
jgi:hypothetical protein